MRFKQNVLGFTLIEMMVAIVIMSIGLLGVAGLQVVSSKYKINSWARSSVATLVADIGERIRVNSDVAGTNTMHGGVTTTSSYLVDSTWDTQQSADLTISTDCATSVCTPAQRATYDLLAWRQLARSALPQGAVWLEGDKSAGFDVTLMWFDKEFTDTAGSVDQTDTANTRTLQSSATCTATQTGMAQQSCCPSAAAVPAGVRCARYRFVP